MITGVVKLAPSLPVDGTWPFLHLDRKFMHLGFHIYDVGFQSPNVDASTPCVQHDAGLLVMVLALNLGAIHPKPAPPKVPNRVWMIPTSLLPRPARRPTSDPTRPRQILEVNFQNPGRAPWSRGRASDRAIGPLGCS
jgi:hypothetical protein